MSAAASNIKPNWALLDDFINSTPPSQRDVNVFDSFPVNELVFALRRAFEHFFRLIEERSRLNLELRRLEGEHWPTIDSETLAFFGRTAGAGESLYGHILNQNTFMGPDLEELRNEIMRISDRMDGVATDVEDLKRDLGKEEPKRAANGASYRLSMED